MKRIGVCSGLHFAVDFLCAASMFANYIPGKDGYLWILIYNFCAFALQMPIGIIADKFANITVERPLAFYIMVMGTVITILGTFTNPIILGTGNALFHVGGGVESVKEDSNANYKGAGLGVFVAPGALGLYVGTLLSKAGWFIWCRITGIVLIGILILLLRRCGGNRECTVENIQEYEMPFGRKYAGILILCFTVVMLWSYIGMEASFPWKTGLEAGIACIMAVVLGKIAGGYLAAKTGITKAAISSLGIAALLYLFSYIEAAGVLALFFFNMSMPMTLYILVKCFPRTPGFSFGLLTFALFLGFLPVYLGMESPLGARLLGCMGSVVSLILLYRCVRRSYADVSV